MNEFQVSADLGRILGKIYCGEGFSNFTADQWRIFISIYVTVILWEYLEEVDRKILTYFVRICHLFVNRILETKSLDEIHKKIVDVVTLIEKKYGRNVITPNLHLSLHLSTCSHDFSPLYAFWCFSFERINRILGSLSNSHWQIELELMRRLINDNRINEMIYTENNSKGLEILNTHQSVRSLSEMDQFGHDEMRRFWIYSRTIQESTISGKEPFPGEMLKPFSENIPLSADGILNLMIAYYNDTYENLKFRKPFETDSLNSIIIPLKINKYCRCRIGSEIFGSTFSPRHQKSSYILVKFASEDDNIDIYSSQIQFFFVYEIKSTISGKEPFPGEMLKPFSENIPLSADGILNLMIAYYNDTYENLKFRKPFETDSLNSIIIPLKINKYCRCRIGSEIFGSTFSPRHQKSSYILVKFASEDDNIDIYSSQIQFFFVYEIKQICNVELWDTEFYSKS
ncbi:hypothetical protein Glove_235g14 [Diversispora epigaea]|uniref:Transposase domain-containing protein n=1 Tax=Diversispora epigaea TaxID=1348612 RepID=A0A397IAY5_9GLOM|nr:hypothetical protein Glove_235g14 [Diversispora epigaea]